MRYTTQFYIIDIFLPEQFLVIKALVFGPEI